MVEKKFHINKKFLLRFGKAEVSNFLEYVAVPIVKDIVDKEFSTLMFNTYFFVDIGTNSLLGPEKNDEISTDYIQEFLTRKCLWSL